MAKVDSRWRGWAPYLLSILRIVTAFLFMQHGAQKLFGFMSTRPGPAPFTQFWIGGVLEFFGGLLVLLGLFTRPVAFVLSGMMAVAARAEGLLAHTEPRRTGHALLLPISLPVSRWRRPVEPGFHMAARQSLTR